jgi:hypothetical protein
VKSVNRVMNEEEGKVDGQINKLSAHLKFLTSLVEFHRVHIYLLCKREGLCASCFVCRTNSWMLEEISLELLINFVIPFCC